jgi:hypothetical protein
MGIARTSLRGVTYYDHSKAYNGYTLFTPLGAKEPVLIDMQGRVVHQWKMLYPPALYGVLLDSGNLLYGGYVEKGPLADLKGAGGELLEVNWDSNIVWNYKDPYLHHSFYRMANENTMVLRWVKVPKDIAAKVKGGIPGTEKDGVIWGDSFQEINPRGKVVWEWSAYEHLDPETDIICPLCPRSQWTEANSFTVLPNGDILASFARLNTICIISKATGDIKWRWGSGGELGHQTDVVALENGNILLFDNGTHCIHFSQAYSRVLEVDPAANKMVWEYKDDPWMAFYSGYMSSCQWLPNDNTLICEAQTGRIFEVMKSGTIVWEFINSFPSLFDPVYGHNKIIPKAYRYGPEYEGLKEKSSEPQFN